MWDLLMKEVPGNVHIPIIIIFVYVSIVKKKKNMDYSCFSPFCYCSKIPKTISLKGRKVHGSRSFSL